MLQSSKYSSYIIEKLNKYKCEIQTRSKNNLNDESVFAENFVCKLLNLCYDYNLYNLNTKKSNFPGIDLGDEINKIGFQVTMQTSSDKVNKTLEKCYKNRCYEKFPNLKIFMLSNKQNSYTIKESYKQINFKYEKDILDFDDLCKTIINLDIDKQKEIYDYLKKQFPDVGGEKQEEIELLLERLKSVQKNNDDYILLNNLLDDSLEIIKNNINDGYMVKANNFISRIFTCGTDGIQKDKLIKLYYFKGKIDLSINNYKDVEMCISKIEAIDDKSELLIKLRIKLIMYTCTENTIKGFLKQISKYLIEDIDLEKIEIEYLVVNQKYEEVIKQYNDYSSNEEEVNFLLAIAYLNCGMFEKTIEYIDKSIKKRKSIKYILVKEQAMVYNVITEIKKMDNITQEQEGVLSRSYRVLQNMEKDINSLSNNFRISYYCTILNILIFSNNAIFNKVYSNIPQDLLNEYEVKSLLALSYAQSEKFLEAAKIFEEIYIDNKYECDLIAMFQTLFDSKEYNKVIEKFEKLEEEQYDAYGVIVSLYISALSYTGENIESNVEKYDDIYKDKIYYSINLFNNVHDIDHKKKYFDFIKKILKYNTVDFTYKSIQVANKMGWLEDEIQILEETEFDLDEFKERLIELYLNANNKKCLDKAKNLIDGQLKKVSNNFKLYLFKAQIEFEFKNWKQSLRYYRLAFQIEKDDVIAANIINLMIQNNIKDGIEEFCTYILSRTKRSDMLMTVARAYDFCGKSRTADELAFQALYLVGSNIDEDLMKQYIGMQMARIQNSISDNINTFDFVSEDCVCILSDKSNSEVINLCINSQDCYESHDAKIFNAKHISMENEIAILLIGSKINDEVELDGKQYIIEEIVDKYVYLFRYITQFYTDSYPESKFMRAFKFSNPEDLLTDIKKFTDEFDAGTNLIKEYKFDNNLGISLDQLTRGESNQYINIIDWLLNDKKQVLYSGERNIDLNLKEYSEIILSLSSIVILYKLNKLYLLDNIKSKIIIPKSLKDEIFKCYKDSVMMKKRGGGRLVPLDETMIVVDNNSSNLDKQWKEIYDYIKTLREEEVDQFQIDETLGRLYSICKDSYVESIFLCKKYNAILLCDDLFLRRLSNLLNINNTNIVSLIKVNSDEESIKLLIELSSKNYYCPTLPIDIMHVKASNEDKIKVLQNLLNSELKQDIYGPIINYIGEFMKNIEMSITIKGDRIYLNMNEKEN